MSTVCRLKLVSVKDLFQMVRDCCLSFNLLCSKEDLLCCIKCIVPLVLLFIKFDLSALCDFEKQVCFLELNDQPI